MSSVGQRAQVIRASPRVQKARHRARLLRDRWIDLPLRQLEQTRRRLQRGGVDVLVLGDSSCLSYAPTDTDWTMLPDLIARESGAEVWTAAGPAFGSRIFGEFVRILDTMDQRPSAVVVTQAIRVTTGIQMTEHPIYGYPQSLRALSDVKSARKRIRSIGRGGQRKDEEANERFLELPMCTRWSGEETTAWFLNQLKGLGPPPWPMEFERLRFDYFHGEELVPGFHGLDDFAEFGYRLEQYGVPVVVHWTKPPLQRGELHFPGEFESFARANMRIAEKAMNSRAPSLLPWLDVDLDEDDFEDGQNATEHFSYPGRVKIAADIADAIRRQRQ